MKELRKLFVAVSLFGLQCSITASAYDFEVDGICYNILDEDAKTVETTYYDGAVDLDIPTTNSYTIKFKDYKNEEYSGTMYKASSGNKTEVTLSNYNLCKITRSDSNLYSPNNYTFYYSGDIVIPDNVTYNGITYTVSRIGEKTFANCANLSSVRIPRSVMSIGREAFAAKASRRYYMSVGAPLYSWSVEDPTTCLTTISADKDAALTSIEDYAFYYASALIRLDIPQNVSSIAENAIPNSTLSYILCAAPTPPNYLLETTTALSPMLLVPHEAVDKYKATAPWKYYRLILSYDPEEKQDAETEYIATAISVSPSSTRLPVGETLPLQVSFTPEKTSNKTLSWTSTDATIASVDDRGTVTAHAIGTCTITATTQDGSSLSASAEIEVIDGDNIALTDGQVYNLGVQHTFSSATYTRTFSNTNWQALYVPFSMEYADWAADFSIARINDVHQDWDYTTGVLKETKLEIAPLLEGSVVEANTPYLIKARTTGTKVLSPTNKTLYPSLEQEYGVSSWYTLFTFKGTYTAIPSTTMVDKDYYAMGGGALIQGDGSTGLSSFRWYMQVTDSNGNPVTLPDEVKLMIVDEWGQETDVTELIDKGNTPNDNDVYYDLSGRRMVQPARGLFVKDGRKVFMR